VTIACKLPSGLHLRVSGRETVTLRGCGHVVKKGIVFSATKTVDARARAVEQAAVRSGFEGMDPNAPGEALTQVLAGGG
jgi:hypothetical protein